MILPDSLNLWCKALAHSKANTRGTGARKRGRRRIIDIYSWEVRKVSLLLLRRLYLCDNGEPTRSVLASLSLRLSLCVPSRPFGRGGIKWGIISQTSATGKTSSERARRRSTCFRLASVPSLEGEQEGERGSRVGGCCNSAKMRGGRKFGGLSRSSFSARV